MGRSKDPSLTAALDDIRDMLEDTIDFVQNDDDKVVSLAKVRARSRATHQVTDRAQVQSLEIMNEYERTSIRALLAWAANEQKTPPETVKAITEVHFKVDDVDQLARRDYEEVIRFLIDLRIDEMKN